MMCKTTCALAAVLTLASMPLAAQPRPLTNVHAHNDYEHTRPLLDALQHGFCSVEADVHLVDGQLLVAHSRLDVNPGKTLQALYLDPLRERVKRNGGHVYPAGPEFTLLVDLKGDWRATYPVLRDLLKQYADTLTTFQGDAEQTNAITVIISGNRSRQMFAGESVRYAALDGDLADLDSSDPPSLVPWISCNWAATFTWRGAGPMPAAEKARLNEIVAKAHQKGRRVRFWGAPDKPIFWRALLDAGVDLINTDDLAGIERFLTEETPGAAGSAK